MANERNIQRLKAKIKRWLKNYKCYFLTLTFNNETLQKTTEQQRKKIVKDYLRNNTALYIANKDYGDLNHREHYHALIVISTLTDGDIKEPSLRPLKNRLNFELWKNRYGIIKSQYVKIERFKASDNEYKKTSQDLANHFYKESTKGAKIIYSRNEPSKKEQIARLKSLNDALTKKENEKIKDAIAKKIKEYEAMGETITSDYALFLIEQESELKEAKNTIKKYDFF